MRRGRYENFDPTKLLPGEWAVVLSGDPNAASGMALYHCFAAGSVKRIATIEDAATIIANATEDIRDELTQDIASALAQVGAATNAANTATANANTATSAANAATQAATSASERAEDAIDAMGDISELAVPEMTPDIRGGAKLEEHGGLALRDGALGIGSLVQESDGYARGGLAEVTAKGHAEQVSTTGKNLLNDSKSVTAVGESSGTVTGTLKSGFTITNGASGFTTARVLNLPYVVGSTYTLSFDATSDSAFALFIDFGNQNQSGTDTGSGSVDITAGTRRYSYTGTYSSATSYKHLDFTVYVASKSISISNVQLELGSTATSYEPYTGGLPSPRPDWEQPIEVVRGRNLLDASTFFADIASSIKSKNLQLTPNTTYVMSTTLPKNNAGNANLFVYKTGESAGTPANGVWEGQSRTVTTGTDGIVSISYRTDGYTDASLAWYLSHEIQLELGSTPTPYVPHGYVGMEVRQDSTVLSTTPIPLPSRGWVGSLPDGTADSLRLDGAGKCEWTLPTSEVVLDGSESGWGSGGTSIGYVNKYDMAKSLSYSLYCDKLQCYANNGYLDEADYGISGYLDSINRFPNQNWIYIKNKDCENVDAIKTWLSTHPVTVLYPLATPVTEDCGYVEDWPTDIPDSATVSIPELDALGIRYFVDSAVTELARQWYARANSEYEDRLEALEEAMATIITGS